MMWNEIKDAMGPLMCFIVGVFAFPIMVWRIIEKISRKK